MIRGLDDDEVTFLEYVDVQKQKAESQRLKEDMQELEEYRISFRGHPSYKLSFTSRLWRRAARPSATKKNKTKKKKKREFALSDALRKRLWRRTTKLSTTEKKKEKREGGGRTQGTTAARAFARHAPSCGVLAHSATDPPGTQQTVVHAPTALSCLGVLPGLGVYTDSSDSENSSFSDDADLDLDLIGRRRVQHEVDHSPKPN
ncbi:unnamed protein product [Ixodes persulcatus]